MILHFCIFEFSHTSNLKVYHNMWQNFTNCQVPFILSLQGSSWRVGEVGEDKSKLSLLSLAHLSAVGKKYR